MSTKLRKKLTAPATPTSPDSVQPAKINIKELHDPIFKGPILKLQPWILNFFPSRLAKLSEAERSTYEPCIQDIDNLARFAKDIRAQFEVCYLKSGKLRGPFTRYLMRRDSVTHEIVTPVEVLIENVVNAADVMATLDYNIPTRGEVRLNATPNQNRLLFEDQNALDHAEFLTRKIKVQDDGTESTDGDGTTFQTPKCTVMRKRKSSKLETALQSKKGKHMYKTAIDESIDEDEDEDKMQCPLNLNATLTYRTRRTRIRRWVLVLRSSTLSTLSRRRR
ncbi:hypothetical protein N7507_004221 [Penicillium longicatenatum]|nr:hypothetical protein N7507_004221 [Penicillium longicatenatum]